MTDQTNSSPQQIQINYVEFPTTDLGEAKRFYGGAFGWTFEDYGPEYVAFESGALSGGFAKTDAVEAGGALVILYADDLEAVQRAVIEHGGEITSEPFSFPGGRRFHFADPSGNELAIWTKE